MLDAIKHILADDWPVVLVVVAIIAMNIKFWFWLPPAAKKHRRNQRKRHSY